MITNKETKTVVVIKDDKKKDKRKLISFISLTALIVVDLVITGVFLIPKIIKNSQSHSKGYQVSEETLTIYDNVISYIKREVNGTTIDEPKSIISLAFYDSSLHIVFDCGDYPSYMNIEMPSIKNASSALNMFKDSVPASMEETIIKEEYGEPCAVTIDDVTVTSTITKDLNYSYTSFIAPYNETTLFAITHEQYSEENIYSHIHLVTSDSEALLFDFYYYNLYGQQ